MAKRYFDTLLPKKPALSEAFWDMARSRMRGRQKNYFSGYKRKIRRKPSTRKRKGLALGRTVTTLQHDYSRQYTRKTAPAWKRKRWTKFIKKVEAAGDKNLGLQTALKNELVVGEFNTQNQQGYLDFTLYSANSDDLIPIANQLIEQSSLDINSRIDQTTKMMFKSAVLDLTIRNTSYEQENATAPKTPYTQCALEVDVYTIKASKLFTHGNTDYVGISQAIQDGFARMREIGTGASGLSLLDRGVTPFECPMGIKSYGMKILKKVKYFLPWGAQATWQLRDPKNRNIMKRKIIELNGCNLPGLTTFFLIVYKPVAGVEIRNFGQGQSSLNAELSVGYTKKYSFKVEGRTTCQESKF